MEKYLKCFLLLPLKEMALRKLAIFLLSNSNLVTCISKFRFRQSKFSAEEAKKELRENIEGKIKPKILKLDLPKSLTKQIIDITNIITLEIIKWKMFHQDYLYEGYFQSSEEISIPDSSKLCWTIAGRIDNKKTAEKLILCNELVLRDRYELASLYCLEDHIPILWGKLPEEQKEYFCVDEEHMPDLHCCWPHVFKGELSRLDHLLRTHGRNLSCFNQWAFEDSVIRCNKSPAEYFFNKLTLEEREASLMRSAHNLASDFEELINLAERFSDTLCYLFSLMTPRQQMETIQEHPVNVLLCYLYWPWQDLLGDNAGLIWFHIPPSSYDNLLQKMTEIFKPCSPKSFPEFFLQYPLSFKKYLLEPYPIFVPACRFLSIFFQSEDTESVEVMLRNVSAEDRVKLVFHPDVLELFYKSILRDRWNMVELCLRETKLSIADRKKLHEDFWVFLKRIGKDDCINRKFKSFFKFLDVTKASADEE